MKRARIFQWTVLLFGLVIPMLTQAKDALLTKASVADDLFKTEFTFTISKDFEYRSFTLDHPLRFVLDFENVQSAVSYKKWQLQKTPIKRLRDAYHKKFYRLVFDLQSNAPVTIKRLPSGLQHQQKIVVTFVKPQPQATAPKAIKVLKKPPSQKVVTHRHKVIKPTAVAKERRSFSRDIIVVIDPGHGGKDPGAAGAGGIKEKNVVLAIAKKLQRLINAEPGFKARLTRSDDRYLGLRQRLNLAHKYNADMFVAIHADAYRHNRAHGASVYALSERGATSEAARWLAQRENESEFVGGLELGDRDYLVRSVLIDLSQTHVIGVSLQMGTAILNELDKFADLHHASVEQAAFVVLKSPDIPSLLVETGFLSNPKEAANLTKPWYQNRISLAIKHGIKSFFVSHPPRGTQLALFKSKRSNKI